MGKELHYQMLQRLNRQKQITDANAARDRLRRKYESRKYQESQAKPPYAPDDAERAAYENIRHPPTNIAFMNETLAYNYVVIPPTALLTGEELLLFRSDTRVPACVFETGFSPRNPHNDHPRPIYRTEQADIHPPSTVCLTRDLTVAALLPAKVPGQPTPESVTYVYLVACSNYYDTHSLQADIGFSRNSVGRNPSQAQSLIYAHEVATMNVAPDDVLAAARISRSWHGNSFMDGCTFYFLHWYYNEHSVKTLAYKHQLDIVKRGLEKESSFKSPRPALYNLKNHGYTYPLEETNDDEEGVGGGSLGNLFD
ncbi:hypothetical protein [Pseudomonas allokribbensis]|uniref:hypothetical protein n=1 Tax=Pseudomonas allokribbensis TaxID=2774460 RepID=UPI001787F793|nr:hypothetical protein [Pseudomonas allokribbensis]